MTKQALQRATDALKTATPVGVLASTRNLAETLARELRITHPVVLSPRSVRDGALRGVNLTVLLVDSSVWPIDPLVATAVLPALERTLGYILRLDRIDPQVARRRMR
jgi:hypothetical protein